MDRLATLLRESGRTVVFTGAGVSTLSGIPDFRGEGGVYQELDQEKAFVLEYFLRDPSYYYLNTKNLFYSLKETEPSIVHLECARLEELGLVEALVTQNIDTLHQRAGSRSVIELHGTLTAHHCLECRKGFDYSWICGLVQQDEVPYCDSCGGAIKPNITFFGEPLNQADLSRAFRLAATADLMVVLGSSLTVYPAAAVPLVTIEHGGRLAIINRDPTPFDQLAVFLHEDLQSGFEELAEIV